LKKDGVEIVSSAASAAYLNKALEPIAATGAAPAQLIVAKIGAVGHLGKSGDTLLISGMRYLNYPKLPDILKPILD